MSATRLRDNIQNKKLIQKNYQGSRKEVRKLTQKLQKLILYEESRKHDSCLGLKQNAYWEDPIVKIRWNPRQDKRSVGGPTLHRSFQRKMPRRKRVKLSRKRKTF